MSQLSLDDFKKMEELYTKYLRYDSPSEEEQIVINMFTELHWHLQRCHRIENLVTTLKDTGVVQLLESSNDKSTKKACEHLKSFLSHFKDY